MVDRAETLWHCSSALAAYRQQMLSQPASSAKTGKTGSKRGNDSIFYGCPRQGGEFRGEPLGFLVFDSQHRFSTYDLPKPWALISTSTKTSGLRPALTTLCSTPAGRW